MWGSHAVADWVLLDFGFQLDSLVYTCIFSFSLTSPLFSLFPFFSFFPSIPPPFLSFFFYFSYSSSSSFLFHLILFFFIFFVPLVHYLPHCRDVRHLSRNQGKNVVPTPNPQPGGSMCPAWVALPVAMLLLA